MNIGRYGIRPHLVPEYHSMDYFEYLHNRIPTWQFGRRDAGFYIKQQWAEQRAWMDRNAAICDVQLAKQRRLS